MNYLIAATNSGCGKTTLTIGLLRALRRKGLRVQPFKCGPDYIDTQYHRVAAGVASVNLDSWFSSPDHLRAVFRHYGQEADACIVEGVMGAYDGYDHWHGSSAEIAHILQIPMILIVNAKSMAYSVAPILWGYKHYQEKVGSEMIRGEMIRGEKVRGERNVLSIGKQEQVTDASNLAENYSLTSNLLPSNPLTSNQLLSGVIFNNVGSERHARLLRAACEEVGVHCYGMIPRIPDLTIPSRHLGLTLENEQMIQTLVENAANAVSEHVDLDEMIERGESPLTPELRSSAQNQSSLPAPHISIARDEAFNFTYRENIDALKAMGSTTFFSPIHDTEIPQDTDFLYLPGGYPEFFLKELTNNTRMRLSIHDYIERGGHALAECGGMMYLCDHIIDSDGSRYPMCGILSQDATMQGMRLHLGYREVSLNGQTWRGHEFHYSDMIEGNDPNLRVVRGMRDANGNAVDTPIYIYKNLYASYLHFYWGNPHIR